MKRYLLPASTIFALLILVSFKSVYAQFTTNARLTNNTFSTALIFPSPSPSATPTAAPTPTPSPTSTPTAVPSESPTPTVSPTPTSTPNPSSSSCPPGTIEISGNGAGSVNTVTVICIDTTIIDQTNLNDIQININSTADTGGNSATGNTDGSTTIISGSSSSTINVQVAGGSNSQ